MEGLVDGSLRVEREASINLSGDLSGDDLEDLLAELNQETVKGGVDLLVDVAALFILLDEYSNMENKMQKAQG